MKKITISILFILYSVVGFSQVLYESFENTTGPDPAPSTNWTLGSGNWAVFDTNIGGTNRWGISTTSYEGLNCAYVNRENIGLGITSEEYLVTPLVTIPQNGKLTFYSRSFTNGDQNTFYQIKIAQSTSSQTNVANFTTLNQYSENELSDVYNIYSQQSIDFPSNLYGQQVYIAFVKIHTQPSTSLSGDRWFLDNVSIEENCITPTNVSVSNILATSANFSWANSSVTTQWEVAVQPTSITSLPTSGTITSNNINYSETNLLSNTSYNMYVRKICQTNSTSDWSEPLFFTTLVGPPSCGEFFYDLGGPDNSYPNNANLITLIEPDNAGEGVTVHFTEFSLQNNADFLRVYDGTSTSAPLIASFTGSTLPGTLSATNPTGCLTFQFISDFNAAQSGWAAEVSCTPLSNCRRPENVTATNPTFVSASVNWLENGTATQWELLALPSGSPVPDNSAIGTLTSSNPHVLTGLVAGTTYQIYVRAVCSETDKSNWSIPSTITVLICSAPNQISVTGITENSCVVSWGNTNNYSQWEYAIQPASVQGNPSSGTLINSNTNNLITNLDPGINYNFFVRGDCGNGNFGNWSIPFTFSTLSIFACGDVFTDYGGINGNYWNNLDSIYTICPSTPGETVTVSFFEFQIQSGYDGLYIFNGDSISSPPISSSNLAGNVPGGQAGAFWGSTNPGTFTSTDVSGCLTFRFRSDESGSQNGWAANVTCATIANCTTPSNLNAINNTTNSILLSWNELGVSSEWEILALPTGSAPPNASDSGITTNLNPYTYNGLAYGIYDFYIRSKCSYNNYSDWSTPLTFVFEYPTPVIVTTNQYTIPELVTDVLVNNPCVSISNISHVTGTNYGSVSGIGYFTNTNPAFPLSSGVVLSSGNASSSGGPNDESVQSAGTSAWSGDSELETIITNATGQVMNSYNATKLEFDFTTSNEFMSFNFVFASEEYGFYQCNFSDSFAFLLTDLVSGVTTNLAVVPGTNIPISVVTIRDQSYNSSCDSQNEEYFDSQNFGLSTNFSGQTLAITAGSAVIPNHPYHIKLVVADRNDSIFDSAVFIEGGNFISGPEACNDNVQLVAFIDENNNGLKDLGEDGFAYGSFVIEENNNGNPINVVSPVGLYTIYDSTTSTYDFSYTIDPEYSTYYSATGVSYNDINIALNTDPILYFPITLTQGYNDVTVTITPIVPPRPGFNYTNKVVYKNLGVTATSGTVTYNNDPATTIVSVSQAGTVATPTGLTYDFANLQPYESRSFNVTMSVPAIPTVNIDDILTTSASVSAPANDINLNNNLFSNTEVVVAAYDPNDISEAHGGKIQIDQFSVNDYLYYTIRFQNMGTASAINVRIENELDAQLDENSIRMVSASHNYIMERVGNQLTWRFDYINLVSHLQNEDLSKGYVTYKIRVKPGFAVGDIIPNAAGIYFDTNPVVVTNTFNTEFVTTLGNSDFGSSNMMVFPNPANSTIQISLQNTSETIASVTITDVLGKNIRTLKATTGNQMSVDVADLSQGVYFVEITTANNLKQVKKLVKE